MRKINNEINAAMGEVWRDRTRERERLKRREWAEGKHQRTSSLSLSRSVNLTITHMPARRQNLWRERMDCIDRAINI